MPDRRKVEEYRRKREAGYAQAIKQLAESLHAKFCDADLEAVGGWDKAVVEHVIREYEALPPGLHSCVIATMALGKSER